MFRETSVAAYRILVESGKLAKANRTVYDYLYHHGPTTQKKTERGLGDTTYTMRPRFHQLELMGLIKPVGKEKCRETGRKNLLWDVTGLSEPKELPKKESMKDKKETALAMVRVAFLKMEKGPLRDKLRDIGLYIKEEL
jgi:hypothetical protein